MIPDRLGNNRLDTFENLLVNPEVGLIFIIPRLIRGVSCPSAVAFGINRTLG